MTYASTHKDRLILAVLACCLLVQSHGMISVSSVARPARHRTMAAQQACL